LQSGEGSESSIPHVPLHSPVIPCSPGSQLPSQSADPAVSIASQMPLQSGEPGSSNWPQWPSQSGDDIVDIASYQTEATISDATGVPEANVPVTIFAATPVEAWVNNTLYNLGPASGITVRTNTLGKIVVKTIAQNLSAAELTFIRH